MTIGIVVMRDPATPEADEIADVRIDTDTGGVVATADNRRTVLSLRPRPQPEESVWRLVERVVASVARVNEFAGETATDAGVVRYPNVMSGRPVFRGTRVPPALIFLDLIAGRTLDDILATDYPAVAREDAERALRLACRLLERHAPVADREGN